MSGTVVDNSNTPSGQRALLTPEMTPIPVTIIATTAPLNVSLPGGREDSPFYAEAEISSSNGQSVNLRGYSSVKPSFNRPLSGDDVANGVLTVTNDDRTYSLTLTASGGWVAARK